MGNQLSGGEQQMLAIGRALMTNPHLLILDEATEGLSPLIRKEIWAVLARLKAAGQAILVIDKYLQELTRVADRHTFIEKGAAAGGATMPPWPPSPACGTATWGLKMTDYAREYDVAAAIPAFMQILADWGTRGAEARAQLFCGWARRLDLAYGASPDETLDLFAPPTQAKAPPLLVFLHGGFWRRLHKNDFAWFARPWLDAGVAVAIVNYGLARPRRSTRSSPRPGAAWPGCGMRRRHTAMIAVAWWCRGIRPADSSPPWRSPPTGQVSTRRCPAT